MPNTELQQPTAGPGAARLLHRSRGHGRYRRGLCAVSGGPEEQKGSSVCRQGKESHSRLSSGSTARFLTPYWVFSRQERVAFKSHGGYGDAELICGFSFKARAFLHRPFPWQARGGYPLLLQISSQSVPITRCNT